MAWLDHVLAIPVIGIQIRPNFALAVKFLELLAPVIDEHSRVAGEIDVEAAPADLQVGIGHGFRYRLTHDNLVVSFKPAARAEPHAGKFPDIKTPELQPYTKLLREAVEHAERLVQLLGPKRLEPVRLGIVATTSLDWKALPPGIQAFVDHLGKLWPKGVHRAETNLLNRYVEVDTHADQCHHQVRFDRSSPTGEVTFALDWQRVRKKPSDRAFGLELRSAEEAALQYFEEFGSGVSNGHR